MLCLYHSADFDGKCSAAIVSKAFPEAYCYGINYGDDVPWDLIDSHAKVVMVDFGLQPFSDMEKLVNKKGDNFLWIDHHKTAMEDYKNYLKNGGREIEGLREEGKAGCELTWEYMFPDKKMPPAVRMLGRYDVWDHSDPDVVPFQFGMKCISDTNPKCNCWKWLLEDKNKKTYESVLNDGYKIEHYQKNEWYNYCKSNSFEVDWEGHKFIALNIMNSGSLVFNGFFKKDKHDGMIAFGYKNGEYVVSLYTDKKDIDLSKIAKKYGGGGHAGACGFSIKKLPFI